MLDYIVSFVPGRMRMRHPLLKNAELGADISDFLRTIPGIEQVSTKTLTGSLLIEYDSEQLSDDQINGLLAQGEEWLNENSQNADIAYNLPEQSLNISSIIDKFSNCLNLNIISNAHKRKLLKRCLAVSFSATLASLLVNSSKLHVIAGGAFALLAFDHVWQRRRAL